MIVSESKSQHRKEIRKLGGTVFDKSGYRMDVNLWFRHKNEALFYIDSVGRVHGPMDQTSSTRLGPIEKTGKEIAYRREFSEHLEKDQWQNSMDFQKIRPNEIHQETKHFETILRDVSSNEMNNHKKSHITLANHYIPNYQTIEAKNYSTTITKQKKPEQGVTVNIVAPTEKIIEKDITTTRERRLIDELLEAREELNTLRRARSVVDTSYIDGDSRNYISENHVSKVVTDVYPSTSFTEKIKRRHNSTLQENTNKYVSEMPEMRISPERRIHNETFQKVESTPMNKAFYSELKSSSEHEKRPTHQMPININTVSRSNFTSESIPKSFVDKVPNDQSIIKILPVQRIETIGIQPTSDSSDLFGEEKTVTIKRKITKRKKATDVVKTLRDSYIDTINTSNNYKNEYYSDSDDDDLIFDPIQNERITPVKSAPKLEESRPSLEAQEEIIVPISTKKIASTFPKNLFNDEKQSFNETQKTPDWDYRETSINRSMTPQIRRQNISDNTSYNTYIQEKDTGPISNYSAHKENLRTQQIMVEHDGGLRALPSERRVNEMTEEIETITLQPIGKGVQDLAPGVTTISRPGSRAVTPRIYDTSGGLSKTSYYKEEHKDTGVYNTMPAMPRYNKFNSARNVNQISSYDLPDSYRRVTSSGRGGQEQVISSSWQTKTESYSGGNRNYQSALSPVSNQGSFMSTNIVTSGHEENRYPLQAVLDTEDLWYQPNLTREDVISALRDKETGSFIIRNSSTFSGAYGLALKVATLPENVVRTNDSQGDLIRHFLIETVEDASGSCVRLKGLNNEPTYPSLAHLVQDHCRNPRALPTRLVISTFTSSRLDHEDNAMVQSQYQYESHQSQQIGSSRAPMLSNTHRSMSSPGVNFIDINHPNPLHQRLVTTALYIGKYDVDRLIGKSAIEQAATKALSKKPTKTVAVEIQLDSTNGVTLTDKVQSLFYTRKFPAQHVLSADFDPKSREFSSPTLQNSGINRGRIIGIVVKKQKMILRENVVHLFCEIDKSHDLSDIILFINQNYLRRA